MLGTKGLFHLCALFAEYSFSQFSLQESSLRCTPRPFRGKLCLTSLSPPMGELDGCMEGEWCKWHSLTLAWDLWQSHTVLLQSNSWAVNWITAQFRGRKIGWTVVGLKEQWLAVKKPTFNTIGENIVQWLKNLEDEREDTLNIFADDTKLGGTDDMLQGRTVIWRNLDRCEEQADSNITKFSNV